MAQLEVILVNALAFVGSNPAPPKRFLTAKEYGFVLMTFPMLSQCSAY